MNGLYQVKTGTNISAVTDAWYIGYAYTSLSHIEEKESVPLWLLIFYLIFLILFKSLGNYPPRKTLFSTAMVLQHFGATV